MTIQPCESAINAVAVSPDGVRYAAAVASYNDIPLTTTTAEGDDYNITFPRELSLTRVPDLGLTDVPAGEYYLWVEIDSNLASQPVRAYANAAINVVDGFATALTGSEPLIPLVDGEASVLFPASPDRQIFDLGDLNAGDKVYLSMLSTPGYGQTYTTTTEYSIMLLDDNAEIVSWYEDLYFDPGDFYPARTFYNFVSFDQQSEIILGHDSSHHYVVVDGDVNVHVRIERSLLGAPTPRQQRVYVRFDGEPTPVSVGGEIAVALDPLDASDYKDAWGDSQTETIKSEIMAKLNEIYDSYNIVFTSSDDGPPQAPYATLYAGRRVDRWRDIGSVRLGRSAKPDAERSGDCVRNHHRREGTWRRLAYSTPWHVRYSGGCWQRRRRRPGA